MGFLRNLMGGARSEAASAASGDTAGIVSRAEAARRAGHLAEALAVTGPAVLAGADGMVARAHGKTLLAAGRVREAERWLAVGIGGGEAGDPARELAQCALHRGRIGEAIRMLRRSTTDEPGDHELQRALAGLLLAAGDIAGARGVAESVLRADVADYDALVTHGTILQYAGDLSGAEVSLRRAAELAPERPAAWAALRLALLAGDRFEEALSAAGRANATDAHGTAFVGYAMELKDMGRVDEAIALLEEHLGARPFPFGHFVYAIALLMRGRLVEGWHHYEFRWLTEPFLGMRNAEGYAVPTWDGQDPAGRTILLRAEQGVGDTINFVRFARWVKALGAAVVLEVQPQLAKFARRIAGIDQVVVAGTRPPPHDYAIHLMSLPHVFGVDLDSLAGMVPYVEADAARVCAWAPRFATAGPGLRVGLAWAGNPDHNRDRHRSLALGTLAPLAGVTGISWYALQKGAREHEAAHPPPGFDIIDLGPALHDYDDTAAAIEHLDLVVTTCTSVAHLAGALGKPVWVLLHQPADWRWLAGRDDTPWYPTMRLFRQRVRGDWDDVVARLRAALEAVLRQGGAAALAARPVAHERSLRAPANTRPRLAPGHRPGMTAVADTRHGTLQYLPDEPELGDALGWYGEWREDLVQLLSQLVAPGSNVLEAGAGVGAHSVPLGRIVGAAGHLLASEARAVVRGVLQQNLTANRIEPVTVLSGTVGVDTTVDAMWLDRLDWLKVTDAGLAEAVVAGADATLWRCRPGLCVAVTDAQMARSIAERVRGYGYRTWCHEAPLYSVSNFNRREGDVFGGRLALALIALPEEGNADLVPSGCSPVR